MKMEFKLPPLPSTLGEILQIISRETPVPDDDRLVAIIEKDPAVSLYVLRQVNSAYYGLRRQITQIHRAIALLGLKRVCNLVLAAALKQTFAFLEDATARRIFEHITRTSVATAAFARDLLTHLKAPLPETAFAAGMLHQLGRLVFLYSAPDMYAFLWFDGTATSQAAPLVVPSCATEHAHFDTDYLQLGASTLRQWGLPDEFALCTRHLHTPDQMVDGPLRTLTLALAAGSTASEHLFAPTDTEPSSAPEESPTLVALAEDQNIDVEGLACFLVERSETVRSFAQSIMSEL